MQNPAGTEPVHDAVLMDRAFALAERARGRVSPNPLVGCVISDAEDRVVGEGWTQPAGQAHAEVQALAQAGPRARGGTAHVTLEPCDHTGRTPPCTAALLAAGVARVRFALSDPNPVARGGAATLTAAGVEVVADVAVDRARQQNEVFLLNVERGRPFVVLKSAMSLDGHTADADGRSQWITGEATRLAGHRLRAEVDAVLVGSQTALDDDPSLTCRLPGWDGPQPVRVVLDRRGRLDGTPLAMLAGGQSGAMVLRDPDPAAVLATLWDAGVRSVLLEGGRTVHGAFLAAGLVDRFALHLGNVLLPGGRPAIAGSASLADAPRLRLASMERHDDDVVLTAYPTRS